MKFVIALKRRGFLAALRSLVRCIKVRLGWRYCTKCRHLVRLRWVKDWIVSPEEPPLFYHYECPICHGCSAIVPTTLTLKAVRNLGYETVSEYVEKISARNG